MSHSAVRIHERGSFRLRFASAIVMTNPKMNNRRKRSIGWPSLKHQKKRFNQRICREPSSNSAGEATQPSINQKAHEISLYRTVFNPCGKGTTCRVNILLRSCVNNTIRGKNRWLHSRQRDKYCNRLETTFSNRFKGFKRVLRITHLFLTQSGSWCVLT